MQYIISIISIGSVYALISISFAMVYGVLRISNFSLGAIMACGAYVAYNLIKIDVNWFLAIVAAAAFCTVLSMLIEFLALRRIRNNGSPSIYMLVASVTVLMIINSLLDIMFGSSTQLFPPIFETESISIAMLSISKTNLIIIVICLVFLALLTWFLKKTVIGISIRAAAADQKVCRLMGINTDLTITLVFAIAGALAGVGGVFLGISYSVYPTLSSLVGKAFMATVIGGMGSLPGAVVGAYILAALQVATQYYAGWSWVSITAFILSVLFLLLRPRGIMGEPINTKV